MHGVLAANQALENRKRNFIEVDGGVVELDSKRGCIASNAGEPNRLDEAAAGNCAQPHCVHAMTTLLQ